MPLVSVVIHLLSWHPKMRLGPIVARFIDSSLSNPAYLDGSRSPLDPLAFALTLPDTRPGERDGAILRTDVCFLRCTSPTAITVYLAGGRVDELVQCDSNRFGREGSADPSAMVPLRVYLDGMEPGQLRDLIRESWCSATAGPGDSGEIV